MPNMRIKDKLERHLVWWIEDQRGWEDPPGSTALQDEARTLLEQYLKLKAERDRLREALAFCLTTGDKIIKRNQAIRQCAMNALEEKDDE